MTRRAPTVVAFETLDRRTPLEIARADLASNLREFGDPVTLAAVLHFVDTMRDNLRRRVGALDYSAEALAFGRVAMEIETTAELAGMRMPTTERLAALMAPVPEPVVDVDADLDRMAEADAEKVAQRADLRRVINHKPRSAKWNRRRAKRRD